jgi:hypothetical protein
MKTIRINRSKWLRGTGSVGTYLWSNCWQGGCCLGHVIHQVSKCGWEELNNIPAPHEFYTKKSILTGDHGCNNTFTELAMEINDDSDITDKEREKKLNALGKKNGIKFVFYGDGNPHGDEGLEDYDD